MRLRSTSLVGPVELAMTIIFLSFLSGCGAERDVPAKEDPATRSSNTGAATESKQVISQILDRYGQLRQYSDVAQMKLSYQMNGRRHAENASIGVAFRRPNEVNLRIGRGINTLRMVSDGKTIWTTVEDAATDNLRNQVVQQAAPEVLTPAAIYSATELVDPTNPNEAVSALLGMPLSLELSQLGLLLDNGAFRQLLEHSTSVHDLGEASIGDVACRRYQVQSNGSTYVFWCDDEMQLFRRIEYPGGILFNQLPESERPTAVVFQVTFENVRLSAPNDSDFVYEPDAEAVPVRFFVLPPLPLPTDLYDQVIPEFSVSTLEGGREQSSAWRGRIQVLTWFNLHETSRSILPQLNQAQQDLQSQAEPIICRAICAQPRESLPEDRLRQTIENWGIQIPVVRDDRAIGRDLLQITEAPTTVVLDRERRLHFFDVGANPQIRQAVTDVIKRLMAGQTVGADVLRRDFAERQAFETQLAIARVVAPTQPPEGRSKLPEASPPQKLTLSERWQNDQIPAPGNLLRIREADERFAIAVLSGVRSLLVLDESGAVARRVRLPLDEPSGITRMRQATNQDGLTFYVGFAQMGNQAHVFDQDFQPLFRYPRKDQRYAQILDCQLADLDNDGELELYVGFADPLGLHRINLDGERVWGNRASPGVVSVAPRWLEKPPYLLTTDDSGTVRAVSQFGREGQPIEIKNRTIHQLIAASTQRPRPTQFLGLSLTLEGRMIAIGLDRTLSEKWSYGLPPGTFLRQVDSPLSAALWGDEARQWICAGPDGSIHIIDDDGSFFDFFHTGQSVAGVIAYRDGERGMLIVSSPERVTAWEVNRPGEQ